VSVKKNKKTFKSTHKLLPDIKVNIIVNNNNDKQYNSDDSDHENQRNMVTYVKLPIINEKVYKDPVCCYLIFRKKELLIISTQTSLRILLNTIFQIKV
jgi:hypothetical protein